jgi:hypothetical protein
MRKGLAAASLLVCTLIASYVAAGAPTAVSTSTPVITSAPPVNVSAFEPEVERVALTSRDRVVLPLRDPQWDAVPIVADEATALLDQLVTAERAVRDPAVTGGELAFMGHLQQLVYRQLIERPDLRDPVFSAIPQDLRGAADLNIAAGADLYLFGPVGATELPAWRIVPAPPIDDLLFYYREAEVEFGVPWYYLAAINLVETRMGRIRGDSYAGAQGPMQFMPKTWDAYGEGDINDTHDAILAAGRYLRASGAPAKIEKAIRAYNHDNEYVDAVMKYAAVMRADPSAFRGYYGWQVYFVTASGTFLLPEGWSKN